MLHLSTRNGRFSGDRFSGPKPPDDPILFTISELLKKRRKFFKFLGKNGDLCKLAICDVGLCGSNPLKGGESKLYLGLIIISWFHVDGRDL